MIARPPYAPLLLSALVSLVLGGCATKEFVQQEVGVVNQRVDELKGLLHNTNQRIDTSFTRIEAADKRIGGAEQNARELGQRSDALKSELTQAGQRIDSVADGLKSAHQRIDVQGAEIARAHQRLDGVDAGLSAARQETAGALQRMAQTEARLGVAETGVAALKAAPVSAAVLAAPGAQSSGAASADPLRRLDEIAAQIAAADKRVETGAQALNAASERITAVEASLSDTRKRVESGEAGLNQARQDIAKVQGELTRAESRITANTEAIGAVGKRVDGVQGDLVKAEAATAAVSVTAQEALDRAKAAGKLAEGKLVHESTLTEELTGFGPYQAWLSNEAKQALKKFADKLLAENQNVYIEVQGHSDTSGKAERNLIFSKARAESVRAYLNKSCGIPLHRAAAVGYGGEKPVADNSSKEGRAKNRRVVLVVLK
ncbi:MAG: OmpA family protein [Betaproteobacteria bacterium]|nr:OmpA family protein [Betaproteobacteria bacterium]